MRAAVIDAVGAGINISVVDLAQDSQVTVNLVDAVLQQPRVVGDNSGSANFKRDIRLYSRLHLDRRFELDALVSAKISLDQIESGYQQRDDPDVSRVVVTRF